MSRKTIVARYLHNDVTVETQQAINTLRGKFIALAAHIERTLPDGREKSLAHTKLEEAAHWANTALSHPTDAS